MDKENVVYTMKYYSALKEENSVTCYNMDKSWGHYVKWNKPVTEGQILDDSNSDEVSKAVRLIEAESEMLVARGWKEGEMR